MARVIGLTGGIASGKSAVAAILRRLGVPVVDADQVAREVVAPGSPALDRVREALGDEALGPDGTLDRDAVARLVFADPEQRRRLEAVLHPAIAARSAELLRGLAEAGHPVVAYEAALLVETGRHRDLDALLVVAARPETQAARLMARDGIDAAAASRRLEAQLPLADKVAVADVVIHNDGDWESLERAVRLALDEVA